MNAGLLSAGLEGCEFEEAELEIEGLGAADLCEAELDVGMERLGESWQWREVWCWGMLKSTLAV